MTNPKVAIFVAQLILGQKIRSPVVEYLPVEKIRVHMRLGVDDIIALYLRLNVWRLQRELFRARAAGARIHGVEDVSGEAASVASTFDGEFCARQPDFFSL